MTDTLDPTAKTPEEYLELTKKHLATIITQAEWTLPKSEFIKEKDTTHYVTQALKHIWLDTLGDTPWRGGAYNRFVAIKIIRGFKEVQFSTLRNTR